MAEQQLSLDLALVDPAAAVRALRDAQYDNTAKAIAELIDNSIDAGASRIELLIEETYQRVKQRHRWRVCRIALADNGSGMDAATLVDALRIGGRRTGGQVNPIGKYGMGLPTASASQCLLAEVWSWQESVDRPVHSRLDIGGIIDGRVTAQPPPDSEPVPEEWRSRISDAGLDDRQGTLVVWSDFGERVLGSAQTLFRQVETEIGRTYRHFINDGSASIRMATFRGGEVGDEAEVRPNDPLFLMPGSATPAPWHEEPMFQAYGSPIRFPIAVEERGTDGESRTREEVAEVSYSMVRPEVILDNRDKEGEPRAGRPGSLPHGQRAAHNMGVSIVRADRELLLDRSFLPELGGERENRWWGCEIRFESGLDDAFGVDHNKQMATHLSNAARALINSTKRTESEAIEELGIDEDDPVYPIYEMVADILRTTRNMLGEVRLLFKQRMQRLKHARDGDGGLLSPEEEAAQIAKDATQEELREGATPTATDRERVETAAALKEDALAEHFEGGSEDHETARRHAASVVARDDWYAFGQRKLYGHQMFGVDSVKGVLVVSLNINHELSEFMGVLEQRSDDLGDPLARRGAVALRTLLLAWARLQDETANANDRGELEHIAMQWGKHARTFLPKLVEELGGEGDGG